MKLGTFLDGIDEDEIVAIGASLGEFVYIGSPRKSEEIRKRFDEHRVKQQKIRDDEYKMLLDYFIITGQALTFVTDKDQENLLYEATDTVRFYKDAIRVADDALNDYIDPLERNVENAITSILDGNIIITVLGFENGQFSTLKEYNKEYK